MWNCFGTPGFMIAVHYHPSDWWSAYESLLRNQVLISPYNTFSRHIHSCCQSRDEAEDERRVHGQGFGRQTNDNNRISGRRQLKWLKVGTCFSNGIKRHTPLKLISLGVAHAPSFSFPSPHSALCCSVVICPVEYQGESDELWTVGNDGAFGMGKGTHYDSMEQDCEGTEQKAGKQRKWKGFFLDYTQHTTLRVD